MKKIYVSPRAKVMNLSVTQIFMEGSFTKSKGNLSNQHPPYGGGGSGTSDAPEMIWDDWEE
ncbi:MAG: hypothetical protein J5661_07515 [Bacteroidaceae bacterium]|nr:hypothetical protein [Bacteroidaceae bacterium]